MMYYSTTFTVEKIALVRCVPQVHLFHGAVFLKMDDVMKFTNETLKAAVRDYLKQAVDKKLIDKLHLEKFDAGTLTDGNFKGLEIIIAQRSK